MVSLVSRRHLILTLVVLAACALGAAAVALPGLNQVSGNATSQTNLPPGCAKPAGGYLIIADEQGYNDSIGHGVPQKNWPIMQVQQGQNVTIVVCNTDVQPHGFNIAHYYDDQLVSVAPGKVLTVSFAADQAGSFRVYCNIPCSVHWAMQNGELVVS